MPTDTRVPPIDMETNIDPQLLEELTAKRDQLAAAYEQVAISLRAAATACHEFQALLPRDVGIISPSLLQPINHLGQDANISVQQRKFRKSHTKDPNAPKRPNTAYILFSNEIRAATKAENPNANQKQIVTMIGHKWKELSREQKKVYEDRYFADKERYDEELKNYRLTGNFDSPPETSSAEDNADHSVLATATIPTGTTGNFVPAMSIPIAQVGSPLTFPATEQTQIVTFPSSDQSAFSMSHTFVVQNSQPLATVQNTPQDTIVPNKKRDANEFDSIIDDHAQHNNQGEQQQEEQMNPPKKRVIDKGNRIQDRTEDVFAVPTTEVGPPSTQKKRQQRRNANHATNGNSSNVALESQDNGSSPANAKRRRGKTTA